MARRSSEGMRIVEAWVMETPSVAVQYHLNVALVALGKSIDDALDAARRESGARLTQLPDPAWEE